MIPLGSFQEAWVHVTSDLFLLIGCVDLFLLFKFFLRPRLCGESGLAVMVIV